VFRLRARLGISPIEFYDHARLQHSTYRR
jgi:hypothetical protein